MAQESKWADLTRGLLDLILHKIVTVPDHIRFGAVCRNWHFAAQEHSHNRRKPMLPLLSMPTGVPRHHILYCWEDKVYPYQYPYTEAGRFIGSSHGWLAFDEKDTSITLLKPFSGRTLRLPPLTDPPQTSRFGRIFVCKVILSHDLSLNPNDYTVATVIRYYVGTFSLAFIKFGEQSWTYLQDPVLILTACFCKGKLYAINSSNNLIAVENSGKPTVFSMANYNLNSFAFSCLVESPEGDLLMLVKRIPDDSSVNRFSVYKLVKASSSNDQEKADWVEMENLGDSAIFLSNDECICISVAGIPNIKRNCIYYKHNADGDGRLRVAAVDLKSKRTEICCEVLESRINKWATFWILPTLS